MWGPWLVAWGRVLFHWCNGGLGPEPKDEGFEWVSLRRREGLGLLCDFDGCLEKGLVGYRGLAGTVRLLRKLERGWMSTTYTTTLGGLDAV